MGLIEEVKDGDTDYVFELMLAMNNGEISIDLDEIIESIMFSLHWDREFIIFYLTMYNYDAAKYVLDELLERKDTKSIQTLFYNSRIMEEIIYNEDLEYFLNKGLNPNIIGIYDSECECTIPNGFLNYIVAMVPGWGVTEKYEIKNAKLLLEHGINPNYKDSFGWTPLHISNIEFTKLLLEYNADPNIRDNDGETPLFRAFMRNNIVKIELLLQYGADPYISNNRRENIFNYSIDTHNNDPFFGRPGKRIEKSTLQFIKDFISLKKAEQNLTFASSLNPRLGYDTPLNLLDHDIMKKLFEYDRDYDPEINIRMLGEARRDRLTKSRQHLASMRSMHSREGPFGSIRYDPSIMENVSRYLSRIGPVPSVQERLMLEDRQTGSGIRSSRRRRRKKYTRNRF